MIYIQLRLLSNNGKIFVNIGTDIFFELLQHKVQQRQWFLSVIFWLKASKQSFILQRRVSENCFDVGGEECGKYIKVDVALH